MTDTRSWTLEQLDHPGIPALLEYKKLSRLLPANGWSWLDTWVRDGRFRPYFLPGGVVTGRWASNGGGALSVPGPGPARRRWPTTAGGSSSPTSPSWSRGCSPA